jgi:hypothetical protein
MLSGGYSVWLERERRVRLRILGQSPEIAATGLHRLCADCGEVLLCHEDECPNCGGRGLAEARLAPEDLGGRMRLVRRWLSLKEA